MAVFAYEALDAAGKARKGELEADTSEQAIQKIKGRQRMVRRSFDGKFNSFPCAITMKDKATLRRTRAAAGRMVTDPFRRPRCHAFGRRHGGVPAVARRRRPEALRLRTFARVAFGDASGRSTGFNDIALMVFTD